MATRQPLLRRPACGLAQTGECGLAKRCLRLSTDRAGPSSASECKTFIGRKAISRQHRARQMQNSAVMHPSPDVEADRAFLAEELGYRKIGADLPDNVSLGKIIQTLPSEVFEINDRKAWSAVLLTTCSVLASIGLIAYSPWYLLPFAWAFAGTAWTGMFVVGHDCGHRSFSKNKLVEDIVGTLMFAPLIYPFEPWRIKHNVHHAHTNKLEDDTAWHPVMPATAESWNPVSRLIVQTFLGSPLKLWASVGHWLLWHFDLSLYTEKQKPRVIVSLAAVAAFVCLVLPSIVMVSGLAGLLKFWAVPWLGYHFWMSTFTVVHHTAPHIPFKPASEWNAAKAQLSGTVHCDYPKWIEVLCHDINVHVPHHVSPKIPWYNLRKATDSLRQNWGDYMTEARWNWRMMKAVVPGKADMRSQEA